MNTDTIAGDWKLLKGRAQAKWGKITHDELDVIAGNRAELAGAIQKSYGIARDEAEHEIREWEKAHAA